MNPEKLKVIAEGMGHTDARISGGYCIYGGLYNHFFYSPDTTNNDQMVEIMERLHIDIKHGEGKVFAKCWGVHPVNIRHSGKSEHKGKTIQEAVCNAAYEYFKGHG
jgi:hypothetical protein